MGLFTMVWGSGDLASNGWPGWQASKGHSRIAFEE
jgi:hypothetical protein